MPLIRPAILMLALLAAMPAHAQRASLADRVNVLEQRANNTQANVDLLNQVTQLKSELQALRAQLEEMQEAQGKAAASGRAQYLDLDGRLNRLEGGTAPVAGTPAPLPAPAATPAPVSAASTRPVASIPSQPVDTAPRVYGDRGTLAQNAGERADYDTAFAALRAGLYADSARLFTNFIEAHPDGSYAPNALYWLGESYYVTGNYALALSRFQTLLDRYPTHDKAAGALLKVGLSQQGLQQLDAAESTLQSVIARYPGSDVARTATDRLNAMQLGRLR